MEFKQQYAAYQQAIEEYLNGIFTADKPYGRLQEAMRYSILGGGKRIRPVLTLEFARLGGHRLASGAALCLRPGAGTQLFPDP